MAGRSLAQRGKASRHISMASLPFFLGSAYLVFERNTLLKHALPVPGRVGLNEPLLAECWVHFERACGLSQGTAESWSLPPQEWALLYHSEPGTLGQGRRVTEQPVPTQGDKCYLSRPQFPHLQEYRPYVHPVESTGVYEDCFSMPPFPHLWYHRPCGIYSDG